jgi:hypothetical protein
MTQEADMMATTQIWRTPRVRAAARRGSRASNGSGDSGRPVWLRLWTLLHAQGLIDGTAGSRDDVTFIGDDRGRMAGWRRP